MMRGDGGLYQAGDHGDGEELLNTGCILKVKLMRFATGLEMKCERKRKERLQYF